jgi:hypothetical protein
MCGTKPGVTPLTLTCTSSPSTQWFSSRHQAPTVLSQPMMLLSICSTPGTKHVVQRVPGVCDSKHMNRRALQLCAVPHRRQNVPLCPPTGGLAACTSQVLHVWHAAALRPIERYSTNKKLSTIAASRNLSDKAPRPHTSVSGPQQ